MKFATFRKLITSYTLWKHNNPFLDILSSFLTDCSEEILIKVLEDNKSDGISGNMYYLNILNNNRVLIGLLFSEENPQEIIMDKQNLKEVIKRWQQLKQKDTDEIAITINNNNKVSIIGRSLTDEEKFKQKQSIEIWRNTPTELKNDRQYYNEFRKKWRSFTIEEIKQLEREFYSAAMNDELAEWDTNEQ